MSQVGESKSLSGVIFVYELSAKCPMVKSYHLCFTLIPWESKSNS